MEYTIDESGARVVLTGSITETDEVTSILDGLRGPRAHVDLSRVTRINSSGVRQWIRFVQTVPRDIRLVLERCPVVFVNQMNMISNFVGDAEVVSVFVPFICTSCEEVSESVFDTVSLREKGLGELRPCEACGGSMEADVAVDEYLAFLRRS